MSQTFRAMYFDGTYAQAQLPQGQGQELSRAPPPTIRVRRSSRASRLIPHLSEADIDYVKALTVLNISPDFIERVSYTRRVPGEGPNVTTVERRRFKTEIQAAVDQLKRGPAQGETSRTIAENLVENLGDELNDNVIERGVKYDLARGDKKTFGRWKREKEAYEEWKLDIGGRRYAIDEDGERVPSGKVMYGAYERYVKYIKPRLDKVDYMARTIEHFATAVGMVESDDIAQEL